MTWVRKALLKSTVPGPPGVQGDPGVNAVENVTAVAAYISNMASAVFAALAALFGRKRGEDPRNYGAVGDGVADDTAAIQAAINAAGAFGLTLLGAGIFRITAALVLLEGSVLRGAGTAVTTLRATTDITILSITGGQGQIVSGLTVSSWFVGSRSTYDIDVTNPTKPVFQDIEVDLPDGNLGAGGIRFRRDTGLPGNAFMPELSRVWIRNGLLIIDSVTDGHFVDGYVWAPQHDARATVDITNSGNGWTFTSDDVIPTPNGGSAYRIDTTIHTNIVGGYVDGSNSSVMSGYGILGVNAGQILATGTHMYHVGLSGVRLVNSHGCAFTGVGFYRNNKQDVGAPDIDLVGSSHNTFLGTTHAQPVERVTKGAIYREDAASQHNLLDVASLDLIPGNFYSSPLFIGNAGTLGKRNRPSSLWPRPSGVPQIIQPPACAYLSATPVAWPAAYTAIFHRFTLADGAAFRYANFRVDAAVGSIAAAVVRMDGLNWTRLCYSGALPAAVGAMSVDMGGATFLAAGEYALVLVANNVGTTMRIQTDAGLQATKQVAEAPSGAFLATSGAIAGWNGSRAVTGLTLSA